MNKQDFIDDLVSRHKPVKLFRAGQKLTQWLILTISLNFFSMYIVQGFRPDFFKQLVSYPRFLFEIVSGSLLCIFLLYFSIRILIPGVQLIKKHFIWLSICFSVFFATLLLSWWIPSPPESSLGMRAHCNFEVFVYGTVGFVITFFYFKNFDLGVSRFQMASISLGSGLVPALFMQMACMYSPSHALVAHYGPVFLIGILGFLFYYCIYDY